MFFGTYKFAEHTVKINSLHNSVHSFCRDYVSIEPPEFEIFISQTDIEYERGKTLQEHANQNKEYYDFSDSQLEITAVYRKLCDKLIDFGVILMHGSVVVLDDSAYLFTAKSGTGKSTHTRLWLEYFGDRAFVINDDKPLIKIENGTATVYGTPWGGKHHISKNSFARLKAVCLLERSETNSISRDDFYSIYPKIFQQIFRPNNKQKMTALLGIIDDLSKSVDFYTLSCDISENAVLTSYNGMKGE